MFISRTIRWATAGLAAGSILVTSGVAQAVPNYPEQDGSSSVTGCINHVSGASRSGGRFVGDAYGSATCSQSYVKIDYVDTHGVQKSIQIDGHRTVYGPVAQIIMQAGTYSRILEVIGSSTNRSLTPTPGVYLYF